LKLNSTINKLLSSKEASIQYKTRVNVLDENPNSIKIKKLQSEIKNAAK
jgi:hypothetical protein